MKSKRFFILFIFTGLLIGCQTPTNSGIIKFPLNKAKNVNPDTHLVLTFPSSPTLGNSGKIRIYDASNDELVDSLDLGIPSGPTVSDKERVPYIQSPYEYITGDFSNKNTKPGTPSGGATQNSSEYQLTIIGGFTDAFHFYPVIINDNEATIYLHHNLLEYDKTYYVLIDSEVFFFEENDFQGITGKNEWRFTTKKSPPASGSESLIVSDDGSGDFNTVQGAVDFIPDFNPEHTTIFIKNGRYEEIVYFRNKSNITFKGENRDSVIVCYANNEDFNLHPANIATNEMPGTFPTRRAVFAADNSNRITIENLTIQSINEKPAQAEGLLIMGKENIVKNTTVIGSGDALQINGSVYLEDVKIVGFGDNILGRGPAFFKDCELYSTYGPHIWMRNTEENHGAVFKNCTFAMICEGETTIARTSDNRKGGYPYSEVVLLNCTLDRIKPEGWGISGTGISNIRYWEYNSINLSDRDKVDVSKRHPISKQLTMENNSDEIMYYSNPVNILGDWVESVKSDK